ncbi:hypothetical protein [Burkholderia contaminans]|uniref:hypothetical protein n=1 Tax=Burkholderia contaminans TaxID=488447 RepID=UPI0015882B22|nr:hypothetical protein [Burkholderia contaminans]
MITALKLLSTALTMSDVMAMKKAKEAETLVPFMDTTVIPPAPQPKPEAPKPVFQPTPFKKHW